MDLTVAQVSVEMVPHYQSSSANSSSRTYARKSKSLGKKREALGQELIESAIPLDFVKYINKVFDDASSFAKLFTVEVCDTYWHYLYKRISWEPNDVSKVSKQIRDWRRRRVEFHNFKQIYYATDDDISTIAEPLISMAQHKGDGKENGLDIVGSSFISILLKKHKGVSIHRL